MHSALHVQRLPGRNKFCVTHGLHRSWMIQDASIQHKPWGLLAPPEGQHPLSLDMNKTKHGTGFHP